MNIIDLKGIHKKYNIGKSSEVHALKNVDLKVDKEDMIAVVGTSGSGKSTLLHIIGCIDRPTEGEYLFENNSTVKKTNREISILRNKRIGFVLQDFGLLLNKSVIENISYPLIFGDTKLRNIKQKCYMALDRINIADLAKRRVEELSGGQRQRVAIARALVNEPDLILTDEPTGSLDSNTTLEIMRIFKELNKGGKTIIIVTHDDNVASICTKNIRIEDGQLVKTEI